MGAGPQGSPLSRLSGRIRTRHYALGLTAVAVGAALTVSSVSLASSSTVKPANAVPVPATVPASEYLAPHTATPIKHLVVLFDENDSFDHYFGTYPFAANTDGSVFHAKPGTPTVNGLYKKITRNGPVGPLLTSNPNEYNPQRLTHSEALTCDQNHAYAPEEAAYDNGKADMFVQDTESSSTCNAGQSSEFSQPGLVMDYFDGNTVTGLWNYAQNYAMSDNNYDTNFGPSTPGALNVISGDDGGGYAVSPTTGAKVSDPGSVGSVDANGVGTIYGDLDPAYDDCSDSSHTSSSPVGVMTGENIGDLLNQRHVTWGWFQGGFAPTGTNSAGYEVCGSEHENVGGTEVTDYSPHHNPFQYYASTANPQHLPPTSEAAIGRTDQANHQYDISDFSETVKDGNMPAVSYLKAAEYQDGHPGYSDPVDEQNFVVNTVNQIMESKYWASTAIVITYDDSDGWYDHVTPPIVNGSHDSTLDAAICDSTPTRLGSRQDRCGYGPRLPLIVISPWTRDNYVSGNLTDQASVVNFIEQNWLRNERIPGASFDQIAASLDAKGGVLDFGTQPHFRPLILNPNTGEVVNSGG
jgi:phospholipase C